MPRSRQRGAIETDARPAGNRAAGPKAGYWGTGGRSRRDAKPHAVKLIQPGPRAASSHMDKPLRMNDVNKQTVGIALSGLASGWLVFGVTLFAGIVFACIQYNICIEPNALL